MSTILEEWDDEYSPVYKSADICPTWMALKYRQNRSNMDKKKRKYSDKETFIAESCIFDDEYMKLIHDFKSKTVSGMYYKELADRARYLKETKEGKDKMGSVVDKIIKGHIDEWKDMGRAEGRKEGLVKGNNIARREIARELLKESKSYEKVASQVKLSIEEIKKIAEEMEKEDKQ